MNHIRLGYAMCGSFCTLSKSVEQLKRLSEQVDITPIMSPMTAHTDTRFGKAEDFIRTVEEATGKKIITTVEQAEPIGPKKLLDVLVIAPCTGNTLAKLSHSIADTPVTMAAKSHLRNGRPVVVAVSTNDGLAGAAENIGRLMARKHYYFVPYGQDDAEKKPTSLVAHFELIPDTIGAAVLGKQIQPLIQ